MRKTKAKNDSLWQVGTIPFVALWAGSYAASWLLLLILFDVFNLGFSSAFVSNSIIVSFIILIPSLLQVQLVERLLKYRMRGWMLYSLVGTLLTFVTFSTVSYSPAEFIPTLMSLFLPLALVQALWLRRHVQSAWLWPLATIAAILVFSAPTRQNATSEILVMSSLLYGIVQGVVMRYLWLQPKTSEKAKIAAAEDDLTVNERSQRLQETDETQDALPPEASSEQNIRQDRR